MQFLSRDKALNTHKADYFPLNAHYCIADLGLRPPCSLDWPLFSFPSLSGGAKKCLDENCDWETTWKQPQHDDDVTMKWFVPTAILLLQKTTSKQRFVVSSTFIPGGSSVINRRSYPMTMKVLTHTENNNHMMMSTKMISHPSKNTSSSSTTAAYNTTPNNCQYVVSRNGKLLSWQQIHQQYRRVDDDSCSSELMVGTTNHSNNNTPLDSNTLLQLLPRGAYTTCRTVKGGTNIYQFDYHVRRLANSAKSILEVQQMTSSSSVGTGEDDEEEENERQDGKKGGDNDGRNDNDKTTAAATAAAQSLATSNHPIQHDRTLSTFEINQLNITNVAWEHDMALKCIRNTLREFCICYGIRQPGLKFDKGGGSSSSSSNAGGGKEEDDDEDGDNGGCADDDEKAVEFKITLLATWEKKKNSNDDIKSHTTSSSHSSSSSYQSVLYCHVGLLKPKVYATNNAVTKKSPHTRVLIHGHGRENALAKDSKWVFDREKLLTEPSSSDDAGTDDDHNKGDIQQPFEEIILINDNGELLEGTQTNFYVVSSSSNSQQSPNNYSIITANEGILYGSVRDSVLRACRHHKIPVELRPPTLQDLKGACGVFISSTSRWVMPVHEVCLGDLLSFQNNDDDDDSEEEEEGSESNIEKKKKKKKKNGKSRSYFYGNCETTENIRSWVLEDVESRSTPIY